MKYGKVDINCKITHSYGMTKFDFFENIRKNGGWQTGNNCKYLAFYHTVESYNRPCSYFNYKIMTGWYTTMCSKQDYINYLEGWYRNNLRNQRLNGKVSML